MVRRNRGGNAKVEAKKDVVKSRAISGKSLLAVVGLAVVGLFALGAVDAQGTDESDQRASAMLVNEQALNSLYNKAGFYKRRAHFWAHKRQAGHKYHGKMSPRTNSLRVETRRMTLWRFLAAQELKQYKAYLVEQRKWKRLDRSMWKAVEAAAREYGVSASWLHNCVSTEGGHGGWVMNHQGSGAGGWFQFMESTFYGNVHRARTYKGKERFPEEYAKWTSRVGQAYTAAYMFKIGQSGQWTGHGCN